jgi:exo-beta-1,3-glucanase (GH17 family)
MGSVARVAALSACLALTLAACGKSQDWQGSAAYVKIGGTVSGLSGTLVLQNNGKDDLSVAASGAFSFGLSIANGAAYAATIKTQPNGQRCTITAGSGIATANVTSIAVACVSYVTIGGAISGLSGIVVLQNNAGNPLAIASDGAFTFSAPIPPGSAYAVSVRTQPSGQLCLVNAGSGTASANVTSVAVVCASSAFVLRPLPAVYSGATGKAINYGPYRTGGPGAETPTDAQVKEDLALLHAAGFRLVRLFGADPDAERILRVAAANFPDMQFQAGVFIFGIPMGAACSNNPDNASQISTGIRLANTYPNVATVSVGNETSFFRAFMPVSCMVGFIQTVRSQIAQPVTADDDYTFYCDRTVVTPNAPECASPYAADPILAIIDFVSIHTYPMSNPGRWDWVQAGTAAGPARAQAMMEASLANAKRSYDAVAGHMFQNAAGAMVRVDSLPIVVGETGWKARQTYGASNIERYAATPMNAKWYYDLLYGSLPGSSFTYPSWQGSAGGPTAIFYFEGLDEIWKGEGPTAPSDDGWGLWGGPDPTIANYGDVIRTSAPRYILCGAYSSFTYSGVTYPAAPTCNSPETYPGAGSSP